MNTNLTIDYLSQSTEHIGYETMIDLIAKDFIKGLSLDKYQKMRSRLERGINLAKNGAVIPFPNFYTSHRFRVRSSDKTKSYLVDLVNKTCECPDCLKGNVCKHRFASYLVEKTLETRQFSLRDVLNQSNLHLDQNSSNGGRHA